MRATLSRNHERLALGALALVVLALFAPVLSYAFVYDDVVLITGNENLRHLDRIFHGFTQHMWAFDPQRAAQSTKYYRPLLVVLLTLGHQLFGDAAGGYHALGLALHVACGVMLWRFSAALGLAAPARLAAAAIFLLHPVQIQAVAWVSSITDPLVVLLGLSCMLAWLRYLRERDARFAVIAVLLYAVALATLERAVALAAPLLLLGYLHRELGDAEAPARSGVTRARRLREVGLQALMLAAPAALWLLARRTVIGTSPPTRDGFLRDTLLTAPSVAQRYLQNLVLPLELSPTYPEHFVEAWSSAEVLVPSVIVAATVGVAWLLSYGSARRRFLLVSAALTFAPALALGALAAHTLVQDRYAYLSLAFLAPWLADLLVGEHAQRSQAMTRTAQVALAVWLVLALAVHRDNLTPDPEELALYTRAIAVAPDSPETITALAVLRHARGEVAPDCSDLQRASQIVREHPRWGQPALVEFALGNCLREHGQAAGAVVAFERAWVASRGGMFEAGAHRVIALSELRRDADALRAARELAQGFPQRSEAWKILGLGEATRGDFVHAEQALLRAAAIDPQDASVQALLARVRAAKAQAPGTTR